MGSNPFPLALFILFLSASLPFSFGNLGPIPSFLWIEVVGPIFFVNCFFKFKNRQMPFPYGSRIFVIAVTVLALWAAIHFVLNPVVSKNIMGAGSSEEGLRTYYTIFVGICIFFYSLWHTCYWMKGENNWQKILTIILWISLIIGFARLVTFCLGFELPLLTKNFVYGGASKFHGQTTYRLGGISEAATLGISSLLSLYYLKRWSFKFLLFFVSFVFLFFMSGGRAAAFGVLASLCFFLTFIERGKMSRALLYGLIILGLVFFAFQYGFLESQYKRLTSIEGGFAQQDIYRYRSNLHKWKVFMEKPILGKGIGFSKHTNSFVEKQSLGGGHGSYLSVLMIFGIGGGFFLFVFLFVSMLRAFIAIKKNNITRNLNEDQLKMLVFILVLLIIFSIEYIAGGNGYLDMRLYLCAGILSGILSRRENDR